MPSHPLNRKSLAAAAGILLALMALLSLAGGPAFAAPAQQLGPTNSITVSGSGEASGTPDVAYINLGVDTVAANVAQAVAEANQDMAAIIAALQAAGVAAEDIQTQSFNVWPEDRYDPQSGAPTGERAYRVQNALSVMVRDIEKVSPVIDAALQAGADSVNGLSFGIADTTELEAQARLKAVEDARQRGAELAKAFGVTLGAPIIISESFGGGILPPMVYAQAGLGGGGPQITPGQLSVSVQLTVTFAIGS